MPSNRKSLKTNFLVIWIGGVFNLLFYSNSFSLTHQKDTLFEIGDRIVYISLPETVQKSDSVAYPVLMALHGSGRNALNYLPGHKESVPFYVHQRNLALKNGYLFVILSNGKNTWGTDLGLENLLSVYEYVQSNYKVRKKWVLWGTSAGGIQMFRMIRNHPDKIERVIGTFPVYDLEEAYSRRKSANFIWKSRAEFKDTDPAKFPEKLTTIPMLIFHGRKDQAVPYEKHSLRLKNEVNALGGSVKLRIVSGGHSTSNWKVYKNHQINKFLSK